MKYLPHPHFIRTLSRTFAHTYTHTFTQFVEQNSEIHTINWIYFISKNELCVPSSWERTARHSTAYQQSNERDAKNHEKRIPQFHTKTKILITFLLLHLAISSFALSLYLGIFSLYMNQLNHYICGVRFQWHHFSISYLAAATVQM